LVLFGTLDVEPFIWHSSAVQVDEQPADLDKPRGSASRCARPNGQWRLSGKDALRQERTFLTVYAPARLIRKSPAGATQRGKLLAGRARTRATGPICKP